MSWSASKTCLGLMAGAGRIHVAQVRAGPTGLSIEKSAVLTLSPGLDWEHPVDLGAALGSLLGREGFTARRVVAGLPGRWLLTQPKTLPPMPPELVVGALRLMAEQEFSAQGQDWILDYLGSSSPGLPLSLLLVATPRPRLEPIVQMLRAAGLRAQGVTATGLALARVLSAAQTSAQAQPHPLDIHLLADDQDLELVLASAGRLLGTAQLATTPAACQENPAQLARELGRILFGLPETFLMPRKLYVWQAVAGDRRAWEKLGELLQADPCVQPKLAGLEEAGAAAPAAALAMEVLVPSAVKDEGVDFLRPKLVEPVKPRFSRTQTWLAGAAAVVLVFVLWLAGDWYSQHQAIRDQQQQLRDLASSLQAAQQQVDKMTQARLWYDRRPTMLDCLGDISQAMPVSADGSVWITSLVLRDDLSGTLAGKAQDEKSAMELVDRLRRSGRFEEVRLLYLRQTDRTSKVVSFALTLQHQAGRKS